MIVDRPRAVAFHVYTVLDIFEQVLERRVARKKIEIAHPDHRNEFPALRTNASVAFTPDGSRRVIAHLVTDKDAVADDVGFGALSTFVVIPYRGQTFGQGRV